MEGIMLDWALFIISLPFQNTNVIHTNRISTLYARKLGSSQADERVSRAMSSRSWMTSKG